MFVKKYGDVEATITIPVKAIVKRISLVMLLYCPLIHIAYTKNDA